MPVDASTACLPIASVASPQATTGIVPLAGLRTSPHTHEFEGGPEVRYRLPL